MNSPHLPVVELRPSHQLAGLLAGAHLGAIFMLVMLPVALWLQISGVALLLSSATHAIQRHALRRGSRAIVALDFIDREQLRIRRHDGTWHAGRVLGSSTVGASCTILNIRLDEHRFPLHTVIMNDGIDTEDFRRLRVWLRWGPRETTDREDLTA